MEQAKRIRILVLHADPFTREGLSATFARYPDLHVVHWDAEPELPLPTPRQLDAQGVSVVVADYRSGVTLATQISRQNALEETPGVLVTTSVDREWEIRDALARGVRGYVLFGCSLDELAAAVRAVHRGRRHLGLQVSQRLAESLSGEPLTSREEEVLRLVVDGMNNKAIARHLDIATGTVKSHLKGIFDKLNVASRTQAICATERRGLLAAVPRVISSSAVAGETSGASSEGDTRDLRRVPAYCAVAAAASSIKFATRSG